MPKSRYYISKVVISPRVKQKIAQKHKVSEAEVREAFENTTLNRAALEVDPERGPRLLVTGTTYAKRLLNGVLYPADPEEGIWRLGTAMPKLTGSKPRRHNGRDARRRVRRHRHDGRGV